MPKTTPIYIKKYFYFLLFLAICFGFFQKKKEYKKGLKNQVMISYIELRR